MNRLTFVFLLLVASCSADGGGDPAPVVDAADGLSGDSFTDARTKEETDDAAIDAGVTPEAGVDANVLDRLVIDDRPFYDGVTINIFDARGPDGACWIPPGGPWTGTDPDTGLTYCLYAAGSWQSVVCDCVFSTYYRDGGFIPTHD